MDYIRLDNKIDRYNSFIHALSWDTKHTYSIDDNIGIEWLLQKMIGVYDDNSLIGLGSIRNYNLINERYATLAIIVKKNYRKQGIGDRLLKELLEYCKELDIELVRVNILKNNKNSLSNVEKNRFNYISIDNNIITYEKKLINKL